MYAYGRDGKGGNMCDSGNYIEDDGITTAFITGYRYAQHDAARFVEMCADKLNERGLTATPTDVLQLADHLIKALDVRIKKIERG